MRFIVAIALLTFVLMPSSRAATTSDCERWFFESGIEPGPKDCLALCSSSTVGMNSFSCPTQCKDLCGTLLPKYIVDKFVHPNSLKEAERNLIAKYPQDALFVFKAKLQTESSARRLFGGNYHNDESDAFRHFVWAALTTKEIGPERARLFLDAHELDPSQPTREKDMDSSNNESGVQTAARLKAAGHLTQEEIEKSGLEALRQGKLKVLTHRLDVPQWRK